MQFLADNYFWFILGGIIILMAIIGYIADKTDFGRNKESKPKTTKPEKKVKEKKVKEKKTSKTKIEAKGLADLSQSITEKMQQELPILNEEVETKEEDLYAPIGDVQADQSDTISQDLYAPMPPADSNMEQPVNIDAINSVEEPIANEPFEEPVAEDVLQPVGMDTLPETEETQPVSEDDDIWKF